MTDGFLHQQTVQANCFHPTGQWIEFQQSEIEQSIAARFEHIVNCYPARIALQTKNISFTYDQLNQTVNKIANILLARIGTEEEPVALLFSQRVNFVINMLGTLKAGKICLPLDPKCPPGQLRSIIKETNVRIILTDRMGMERLNIVRLTDLTGHALQIIQTDRVDGTVSIENPSIAIPPERLSWIYYTSGSTGQAKAVVQNQRNILNEIRYYTNAFKIYTEDRLSFVLSVTVIGGMREMLLALLNGATLYPFELRENSFSEFAAWLAETGVTVCRFIPTIFRHLAKELRQSVTLKQVRLIYLGGELVTRNDVEFFKQYFPPNSIFVHIFGTSETGHIRSFYISKTTQIEEERIPMGYAAEDIEVYVCNDMGQAVEPNQIGEIVVRSRYLAIGYWHNEILTKAAFFPASDNQRIYRTGDLGLIRPDGCLEYHGRKDDQVKIRGFRVKLNEIETILNTHPEIENSVVVERDKNLVAYVITSATSSKFHTYLASRLPDYMIPSIFIQLEALPFNSNNELDRDSLPEPNMNRPMLDNKFTAPRTSIEKIIAGIWAELLNLEYVGVHDNFFELGGHSITLVHMLGQIEREFSLKLSLNTFFSQPTIAHLIYLLSENKIETPPLAYDGLSRIQQKALEKLHKQLFELEQPPKKSIFAFFEKWHRRRTWNNWSRRRIIISMFVSIFPYPIRRKLFIILFRSHRLRGRVFKREIEWTRQFLDIIDGRFHNEQTMINCLLYSSLDYYKLNSPQVEIPFDSQLIEGAELIKTARSNGKGIILILSHSNLNTSIDLSAITPFFHVAGIANYLKHFGIQDSIIEREIFSRQLDKAYRVLQEGGLVRIASDGQQGHSAGAEFNFHGRRRIFFYSFAELALITGAAVIVVARNIDTQGKDQPKFVGPLDTGNETMSHRERASYIVSQYVAIHDRMWREMPWMIPWYQMVQHLDSPPIYE